MAKYIFLCGMYYPRSSANGVCCKNIVDALIKQGNEVTCIVNDDVTRKKDEIIDGARVVRIRTRLQYRLLEWCHYHQNSRYVDCISRIASLINKIQLFIMAPFWPCISPGYTRRFYKTARRLLNQEKYDAVISAYTPIDTLYAGYMIKKDFPEIRFVPYYLDALAGGWGPTVWSKSKTEHRTRNLESKIDAVSDLVISMQSSKVYHTENQLPNSDIIRRYFLDVPTFVPTENKQEISARDNVSTIKVLYSGSIHFPDRDPRPVLEYFVPICNKHNVELLFMGSNNCPSIFAEYSKKTNNRIRVIGQFSHKEAVEQLKLADILVNIGSTNPNTVTCKIFEYMQLMKPIISTYRINNEPSIPYLEKYGCYFLLNEIDNNFENHLEELVDFILKPPTIPCVDFSMVFYNNTPQAFIDLLNM